MSSDLYDCLQQVATDLLTEFDCRKNITVTRNTGGINGSTGEFDPGTGDTFTVIGVTVPWNDSDVDETRIFSTDIRLVIDHEVEPIKDDIFDIDGLKYTAVDIKVNNPGGIILNYEVQLRK